MKAIYLTLSCVLFALIFSGCASLDDDTNGDLRAWDVSYVIIYREDRNPKLDTDHDDDYYYISPVSDKIPIKVTDDFVALFWGYNFSNFEKGIFPDYPLLGCFYYYVFYSEKGEVLFAFHASKKWTKTLTYIELEPPCPDKKYIRVSSSHTREVEIINKSIYDFLMKLFDNNKIKKLDWGVG